MKVILSIVSILVFVGCFGLIMEYQERIPLYVQIPLTLILVAYEILIFIKINKEK